ncbi:MAG: hypothetical protein WAV89_16215 [Ignavibacteriaceae bacterium]
MGQQQLLLIVLGVIIVGIAVVVGINLFNVSAESSAKDTVVAEATNLGAMALQYYKKPTALGGGGNSFVGFGAKTGTPHQDISPLDSTSSAKYTITPGGTADCTILGDPSQPLGYSWKVTVKVTKAGGYSTTIQ